MTRYRCDICNVYEYNDEKGDTGLGIKAGLKPEDFPDEWRCPVCRADKTHMKPLEKPSGSSGGSGKTVSDVMVETMVNWGVDTVFGMVGHTNLGIADAVRKQEEKGKMKYIGIRHEGAGAFAASAYAKLTGKPAACMSIAGPGATNMLTGLWDAKMDRMPVLALVGQVDEQVIGRGAFQEIDLKSAYDSVSSFNKVVLSKSNHAELANLAIKNAILDRDVSSLIFPNKVQASPSKGEASGPEERIVKKDIVPSEESVKKALDALGVAERPVIIVGHGARFSMEKIIKFAELFNIPVITTFKAKGQISDLHPLGCGVLGRSGTPVSVEMMDKADLLLVFGASFSKHTGISENKPTIQIDFDPASLAKDHRIKTLVLGEIDKTMDILLSRVKKLKAGDQRPDVKKAWDEWREEKEKRANVKSGKGIPPAFVFKILNRLAPEDAVIALDVGDNTYSFGWYFESKKNNVVMSGYLGSIGFGYPAAMGIWAANTGRPILALTGDGGFAQYMGEVTTAVKYKMPIKHILLNNSELGKISAEQRMDGFPVWKTDLHNPNFAEYAKNCGALGIRVEKREELESALNKLFKHKGPGMVEILTDPGLT